MLRAAAAVAAGFVEARGHQQAQDAFGQLPSATVHDLVFQVDDILEARVRGIVSGLCCGSTYRSQLPRVTSTWQPCLCWQAPCMQHMLAGTLHVALRSAHLCQQTQLFYIRLALRSCMR